jgi:hypothetical protein
LSSLIEEPVAIDDSRATARMVIFKLDIASASPKEVARHQAKPLDF